MTSKSQTEHGTEIEPAQEASVEHIDFSENLKDERQVDKFGSAAKVDLKEIALVKKLDLYLMVIILNLIPISNYSECG